MKLISIKQPFATLICAGVKDVENRSWKTTETELYIHASGFACTVRDLGRDLLPVFTDYDQCLASDGSVKKDSEILDFDDPGFIHLKNQEYQKEFELLKTELAEMYDNDDTLFLEHAIIGKVTIKEIVENANSKWADPGSKHWIIENPVLFDRPIRNVAGHLKVWDYQGTIDETPKQMVRR